MNNGFYKTYKYMGIDQPATKATKAHGSSKGTFVITTEGSTASLDPKYYSNVSTSHLQATSSTKECNLFGMQKLKNQRDLYVAQNHHEILEQLSKGYGEHLPALASFSMCDPGAHNEFIAALRPEIHLFLKTDAKRFGQAIDRVIDQKGNLNNRCLGQI